MSLLSIAFLSERTAAVCHRVQGYILGLFYDDLRVFIFAYCSALVVGGFAEDLLLVTCLSCGDTLEQKMA